MGHDLTHTLKGQCCWLGLGGRDGGGDKKPCGAERHAPMVRSGAGGTSGSAAHYQNDQKHQGKPCSQALAGPCFTHAEKKTRSALVVGLGPLWPAVTDAGQLAYSRLSPATAEGHSRPCGGQT